MGQVSQEQIGRAKEIGIEDYILLHEPDNVKRVGHAYYLKDHDSLEISNGLWNWHSQGVGGKNVIDYLIFVRGYSFVDAVRRLAGDELAPMRSIAPKARPPTEKKQPEHVPFRLPPHHTDNNRVISYLESRVIDRDIIFDCIKRGNLYESATWHNCVFVGRDENGKAKFTALRGTTDDFKCDTDGSDKSYGFCLPPKDRNCKNAVIFESPIDALSHKVLFPEVDSYRLSLGCTALAALTRFLETHPEIESISVCTDNDEAGNLAANKIAELPGYSVTRSIPPAGKDWNETLQKIRKEVKPLEDKRKDIRFITPDYKTLFTVKDGDKIKFTAGFDGEVSEPKCRFIDETHTKIGSNYYHICEFAERIERNGSKYEPIPDQKPKLNILAAKYGEALQDVEIPMTDAAIKKLVGGKYAIEPLRYQNGSVFGAVARGKDGIAVCGMADDVLTSLHPYNAQTQKREMGVIEASPPGKADFLGKIDKFKEKAAAQIPKSANPNKTQDALE
jgi:hypothetical protein